MLGFGSVFIYRMNSDARQLSFSTEQAMRGQQLSTSNGCIACHTVDGSPGVGPSWLGMWGRESKLQDGTTVTVDAEYFKRSIRNPGVEVVQGYPNVMLNYFLSEEEIEDLIAFAVSLSDETR